MNERPVYGSREGSPNVTFWVWLEAVGHGAFAKFRRSDVVCWYFEADICSPLLRFNLDALIDLAAWKTA